MKITEEITTAIERKKYTIGVFIDLKKAFDTIDHYSKRQIRSERSSSRLIKKLFR